MKMLILCLTTFMIGAPALAERTAGDVEKGSASTGSSLLGVSDSVSEAASMAVNVACKTGKCPNPVNIKPASIMDEVSSRNYVQWVMNGATGTPPALDDSEGKK